MSGSYIPPGVPWNWSVVITSAFDSVTDWYNFKTKQHHLERGNELPGDAFGSLIDPLTIRFQHVYAPESPPGGTAILGVYLPITYKMRRHFADEQGKFGRTRASSRGRFTPHQPVGTERSPVRGPELSPCPSPPGQGRSGLPIQATRLIHHQSAVSDWRTVSEIIAWIAVCRRTICISTAPFSRRFYTTFVPGRWVYAFRGQPTYMVPTNRGLVTFNPELNKWESFTSTNSALPDSYLTGITEDAGGRIWLTERSGIVVLDP
jgi:hypothetical protein